MTTTEFIQFLMERFHIEWKRRDRSGIYGLTQRLLAYNSNKIEGSTLTEEQTASLFDTGTLPKSDDYYRASGAGGQHINKTDSAVRITHLPTGIVATSQDGRSQHDNRDKAMKALVARVYDYFQSQQTEAIDSERKSKVGTGDRAEKIRTYNYPQNRVTDHRIGLTIQQLDRIIEGKLDDIITALINEDQRLKLEGQK